MLQHEPLSGVKIQNAVEALQELQFNLAALFPGGSFVGDIVFETRDALVKIKGIPRELPTGAAKELAELYGLSDMPAIPQNLNLLIKVSGVMDERASMITKLEAARDNLAGEKSDTSVLLKT